MISSLVKLRKELHQHPELSGEEKHTAKRIHDFLIENGATDVITDISGNGVILYYSKRSNNEYFCFMSTMDVENENKNLVDLFAYRQVGLFKGNNQRPY